MVDVLVFVDFEFFVIFEVEVFVSGVEDVVECDVINGYCDWFVGVFYCCVMDYIVGGL